MVDRIKRAARDKEKFRVFIILPLLPGFEGEIDKANSGVLKMFIIIKKKQLIIIKFILIINLPFR